MPPPNLAMRDLVINWRSLLPPISSSNKGLGGWLDSNTLTTRVEQMISFIDRRHLQHFKGSSRA